MKNLLFELLVHFVYQCLHSKTISSSALDKLVEMIEDIETQTDRIEIRDNESQQADQLNLEFFQLPSQGTTRIYGSQECAKLDHKCRSLLMTLEHIGVLDHISREAIIDKVMLYDDTEVSLETLKWAILTVLGQELDAEDELWLRNIIALDNSEQSIH